MHIFETSTPVIDELFWLTNKLRTMHSLNALVRSFPLSQAAQWMAHDMFENNYIGHQDSRGRCLTERLPQYGYPRRSRRAAIAENVSSGQVTAAAAIQTWMDSEERFNILRDNWVSVGLGHCAQKWVQVFGSE